ncbi:MAG: hypothetical protein P8170_24330 [Gemmatimonadota bacterium]|jgi:hypothetical protein
MHLLLALVCDHAGVNPEGKLDVHGVFNDLYAPGFPAKQERMVLVVVVEWDRQDEGRYRFRVDLEDDAGKPTLSVDGYSDVDRRPSHRPPPRTRLILPLEDVVFPRAGGYTFRIRIKGQTLRGPDLYLVESDEAPEAG